MMKKVKLTEVLNAMVRTTLTPPTHFLPRNFLSGWKWVVPLNLPLLLALASPAHAQRVALVVGNANYSVGRLTNPPNDVAAMESALTKLGFKVQKVLNANQNQLKRAVRDFGTAAQGAEVAFVYYSGHGTQALGENYLLPIGAAIEKESDYGIEAVSAYDILQQIQGARPKAAILVLDACRDNPMAATSRSDTKGLGRMDAPTGTMIAFATAPNTTASDNGDYAKVLAREMQKPGLELVDVFRKTTAEVRRLSGGKQEPRISEMSISEPLYLAGPGTQVAIVTPVPTGQPVQTDAEQEAWELAKRRDTAQSYQAYLGGYPHGRYATAAQVAILGLLPTPQQHQPPSAVPPRSERPAAAMAPNKGLTAIDASGRPTTPGSHSCVEDNATGLLWSAETMGSMNWNSAVRAGNGYSRCGHGTGWRLPTESELRSIVRKENPAPTIDTAHFPQTESRPYWTQDPARQGMAWVVNFRTGYPSDTDMNGAHLVRLVHSGR